MGISSKVWRDEVHAWWARSRQALDDLRTLIAAHALGHDRIARWNAAGGARWSVARRGAWSLVRAVTRTVSMIVVMPWARTIAPGRAGFAIPERVPPPPAQARIVANPVSGSMHGSIGVRELRGTAHWLTEHGLPTELCLTDGPGSARQLADEAVRAGMRMVVAAGGDGTINEVVQALAGHTTALGVLPVGTVNVWAREMHIPLHLAEARAVLLQGVRRRIDLGRADSRYFLLMAGIGIDAEAARRVEHQFLKRIGLKLLDYMATGGVLGVTQRPTRVWIRHEGRHRARHVIQVVIGNTRLWGGAFTFTQRAVADDGWLDVVMVGGLHLRQRALVFARALLRRPSLGPGARYDRVRSIRLESEAPLPVQVDGEVIGFLPMTFAVCPRALTVIVPRGAPEDLFLHPPLED
jgi:diacylglycerol kinase (ATP)